MVRVMFNSLIKITGICAHKGHQVIKLMALGAFKNDRTFRIRFLDVGYKQSVTAGAFGFDVIAGHGGPRLSEFG